MARSGLPILLSTGMTSMDELEISVRELKSNGCEQLAIMQCTAEYPAPASESNLLAMRTLAKKFDVPVGYSDHTQGISAAIAAVALGATVYEKHFTLDKTSRGPDHRASLELDEMKALVAAIREVEGMLGDGVKRVMPCEAKNKSILQKYVVATRELSAGTVLTEKDITTKRTGGVGISAIDFFGVIGRQIKISLSADDPVKESDLA
jgi:N,N'-diacetyllegionaminate synthase